MVSRAKFLRICRYCSICLGVQTHDVASVARRADHFAIPSHHKVVNISSCALRDFKILKII